MSKKNISWKWLLPFKSFQRYSIEEIEAHPESKFVDLQVCSVNVTTRRGRSREIVAILERRSVGICSVQENKFRGKSVRMISGKAAEYKLLWIGNEKGLGGVGIFLVKKWFDKIIYISSVSYKNGYWFQKIVISMISVYAPQCSLDDS